MSPHPSPHTHTDTNASASAKTSANEQPRLISLAQASVHFGLRSALAPVSMTITRGERIALLGANGSGKSTLLRLLHGQQKPSTGVCHIHPQTGGTLPHQVMVFQQPHMLRLSSLMNIAIALWLAGKSWRQAREEARAVLCSMGFAHQLTQRASAMSVGQRQRLALVRAWALKPDILFLDEPTASLDPGARREVEALIERFAQHGVTMIFSTHNLGQAKRLATRVIYLEQGQKRVDLPTPAFFDKHQPNDAAAFLQGERL